MLLWSTDALDARVISATEKRFSVKALLELRLSSTVINASMSMARDSFLDPFTWSLSATGQSSDDQALRGEWFIGFKADLLVDSAWSPCRIAP